MSAPARLPKTTIQHPVTAPSSKPPIAQEYPEYRTAAFVVSGVAVNGRFQETPPAAIGRNQN